jgi:hypothetical protein
MLKSKSNTCIYVWNHTSEWLHDDFVRVFITAEKGTVMRTACTILERKTEDRIWREQRYL